MNDKKSIREKLKDKIIRKNVWIMSDISNNEAVKLARKIYNGNVRKMYEGIKEVKQNEKI